MKNLELNIDWVLGLATKGKGEFSLKKQLEIMAYNQMMSFIMNYMLKAAAKNAIAAFFFTGIPGAIFTYLISFAIKMAASEGVTFGQNRAIEWIHPVLQKVYIGNMDGIHGEINSPGEFTEAQKKSYRQRINNQLKNFYNLSRFLK